MARYTAELSLPAADGALGISQRLSQALLAVGLDLVQTTPVEIAASAGAPAWSQSLQLLLSWSPPRQPSQPVVIALEVISRESMTSGAPRTRQTLLQLLAALEQQLPALQVRCDLPKPFQVA